MNNEDEYSYFEDILWIILVFLLIIGIGYYSYYYYYTYVYVTPLISPNISQISEISQSDDIYYDINNNKSSIPELPYGDNTFNKISNINDVSPPKLVNLYNEDYKVIRNKNDLECTNKDTILLYDSSYKSTNDSFDVELMRPFMKKNVFDKELEKVYSSQLSENDINDTDDIFDYSLKKQKTDLPIANIPVYALMNNKNTLKLSDSF